MLNNRYGNFVKPSSEEASKAVLPSISGEEARRIYLEEIKEACDIQTKKFRKPDNKRYAKKVNIIDISNKDLFLCVQNDDVDTLTSILDTYPDKLNITDEFGWNLLMIACQANAVDSVKELLKRDIDTSIRDKAGNSARSLVIKNRNLILADILLTYKNDEPVKEKVKKKTKLKKEGDVKCDSKGYMCGICNKEFPDKEEHLSSTVHNISASKDKKIPTNYVIPQSNRGYQIMLRVGWDKESGLGPDGSGNKYPIKTVQKQDRKGLGLEKNGKIYEKKETVKSANKKTLNREYRNNRNMEINFRRQFY